jgi:SulP family sulfate permease
MRYVPSMDGTGLHAFRTAVEKMQRDGVTIFVTGIQPQPMKVLHNSGVADLIGIENFCGNIDEALEQCNRLVATPTKAP